MRWRWSTVSRREGAQRRAQLAPLYCTAPRLYLTETAQRLSTVRTDEQLDAARAEVLARSGADAGGGIRRDARRALSLLRL